jgi:hypothetical protein
MSTITKRKLIEALEALDCPDDTPLYSASDDEGNSYNQIHYLPSVVLFEKDEYSPESYIDSDVEDCDFLYFRDMWAEDNWEKWDDDMEGEPNPELDKLFLDSMKDTHVTSILL